MWLPPYVVLHHRRSKRNDPTIDFVKFTLAVYKQTDICLQYCRDYVILPAAGAYGLDHLPDGVHCGEMV